MPVQWTEDLETGIAKIDAQHRELYRAVSSLHEAARHDRLDEVPVTLEFLRSYVAEHFASEEEEMAQASYPELAGHRAYHREFVEEFARFQNRVEVEGVTAPLVGELSRWLVEWLRNHVRRVDGAMALYLRAWRAAAHAVASAVTPHPMASPVRVRSKAESGKAGRRPHK